MYAKNATILAEVVKEVLIPIVYLVLQTFIIMKSGTNVYPNVLIDFIQIVLNVFLVALHAKLVQMI